MKIMVKKSFTRLRQGAQVVPVERPAPPILCAVIDCNAGGDPPHHIWHGNGQRVDCVFQRSRKSGTPAGIIHPVGCCCNLLPLCFTHHRRAHDRGDLWLYAATEDYQVKTKLQIRGKL